MLTLKKAKKSAPERHYNCRVVESTATPPAVVVPTPMAGLLTLEPAEGDMLAGCKFMTCQALAWVCPFSFFSLLLPEVY